MSTTLSSGLAAGAEPGIDRLAGIETAAANGDPLIFVYGPGTDDAFVDAAYRVCEIEECLWEVLHGAGFQRIAFFSLDKKFYFRDEESRGALRPGGGTAQAPRGTGLAAAPGGRRRMRDGFAGPFGDRVVIQRPTDAQPGAPAQPSPGGSPGGTRGTDDRRLRPAESRPAHAARSTAHRPGFHARGRDDPALRGQPRAGPVLRE